MTPPDDSLSTRDTLLLLVRDVKEIKEDVKESKEQNQEIMRAQEAARLQAALGNQRLDGVEKRVDVLETDKRSTAAWIACACTAVGSVGVLLWDMLGKHV